MSTISSVYKWKYEIELTNSKCHLQNSYCHHRTHTNTPAIMLMWNKNSWSFALIHFSTQQRQQQKSEKETFNHNPTTYSIFIVANLIIIFFSIYTFDWASLQCTDAIKGTIINWSFIIIWTSLYSRCQIQTFSALNWYCHKGIPRIFIQVNNGCRNSW